MYALNTTFPTYLFFNYENFVVESASEFLKLVKSTSEFSTSEPDIKEVLSKSIGLSILEFFVEKYPSIVFGDNCFLFDTKDLNKDNFNVGIFDVLNNKIDLKQIVQLTDALSINGEVTGFKESLFYSYLFDFIYKIFFLEISKNVNFFYDDNIKKRIPINMSKSLEKYVKYEKEIKNKKVTISTYDSRRAYLINSKNSLKPAHEIDVIYMLKQLNYYTEHIDKNLILYNIIVNSISFRESTSVTYRNKIYRDIFKNIACYYFPFDNVGVFFDDTTRYTNWFKKLNRKL